MTSTLKNHHKYPEYSKLSIPDLIKETQDWVENEDITKEDLAYKIYQYYLFKGCLSSKQKEQLVLKLVSLYILYDLDEGMCL
jgi:hypothetical protein